MARAASTSRIAYAFFGVALLIALTAGWVLKNYLSALRHAPTEEVKAETVAVVAARRTLYQGVAITNDDLFVINVPPDALPLVEDETTKEVKAADVYASRERVVGQVPRERVLANEFIRPERLSNTDAGVGLNAIIPRGMRAISVALRGADAVAGFLQPGNYVDILATMTDKEGKPRTETILQSVFVLGVNSRAQNESDEDAAERGQKAPSVTFLVTPKQAEDVAFADELGNISLSLRNVQDVNYVALAGADLNQLLDRLKTPTEVLPVQTVRRTPPKPKEESQTTVIIMGGQSSTVRGGLVIPR